MSVEYHPDHIYDIIEFDSNLRRVLDVFQTEITLSQDENQIGIISRIFPTAIHRKWEHQLGLYHIIKVMLEKGFIPTGNLKKTSLQLTALLHNIGHCFHSYVTEEAIAFLWTTDDKYYRQIRDRYQPIVEFMKSLDLEKELERMMNSSNHFDLHRWETALIFLKHRDLLDQAKSQLQGELKGVNLIEMIKYLLYPSNSGYKLLRFFDRVDYVLRDIYYLGVLRFEINLPYLLSQYSGFEFDKVNELEFIHESLYNYVNENIYMDKRVTILRRLLQKKFLNFIYSNDEIDFSAIERLRNIDLNIDLNIPVANEEFHSVLNTTLRLDISSNLVIEKSLLPEDWNFLSYPNDKHVLILVTGEEKIYRRVELLVNSYKLTRLRDVLTVVLSIDKKSTNSDFREEIMSFIMGKKVRLDWNRFQGQIIPALRRLIAEGNSQLIIDAFVSILRSDLKSSFGTNELLDNFIDTLINGKVKQFQATASEGGLEEEDNKSLEEFLLVVEKKLLQNSAASRQDNALRKVVDYVMEFLKEKIRSSKDNEIALETFIYLFESLKDRPGAIHTWVMPSTRIVGNEENEIDCITIELHESRARLNFIEATTNDGEHKALKDALKLEQIVRQLKQRFEDIECDKIVIYSGQQTAFRTLSEILEEGT